jgi:hypothetical protein
MSSGPNVIKFLRPYFTIFCNKLVFAPGKLFQPSQMFVGESRTHPSEVPFKWYTLGKAPSLTHKD